MITTRISVDFALPNMGACVEAMQGDGATRKVAVTLRANGLRWEPPAGVDAALAYRQPDGHKGIYDKQADDTAAITVSGNVASVVLIPQMLTVPGDVQCQLIFNDSKLDRLTSFPFVLKVSRNEIAGAAPVQDYIRLQWMEDKLDELLRKAADSGQFRGEPGKPGEQGPQGEPGVSTTVNGKAPDEAGNVTLTAADVGALPSSGGDMTGAINMNGQPVSGLNPPTEDTQAANKGYVDAAKAEAISHANVAARAAAPRNLLDNSDFRNPVEQAGRGGLHGTVAYAIDRWVLESGANAYGNPGEDLRIISDKTNWVAGIMQRIDPLVFTRNKAYTFAVYGYIPNSCRLYAYGSDATEMGIQYFAGDASWRIYTVKVIVPDAFAGSYINFMISIDTDMTGNAISLKWAALYEGEYTAETLPEYQPKGYAAELAECKRYYQAYDENAFFGIAVTDADGVNFQGTIPCGEMRVKQPTIIGEIAAWDGTVSTGVSSVATVIWKGNGMRINGALSSNVTQGQFLMLHAASKVAFSADL